MLLPNGGGIRGRGGFNPPTSKKGNTVNNPQLLTSTGGLLGTSGILMAPAVGRSGKACIIVYDPSDFNCEDDAEYDFRQEANYGNYPGEGRSGSFNKIILKYRELGKASFNINITVYIKRTDTFNTVSIPVSVPSVPITTKARLDSFPDKKIHTVLLYPPKGVIQGERPQVSVTSKGNSGPYSITSLILCGDADESSAQ